MVGLPLFFLLAVAASGVFCDVVNDVENDVNERRGDQQLVDRMERLERLSGQLQSMVVTQDSQIRHQAEKLRHQDAELRHLNEILRHQQQQLRLQDERGAAQEETLQRQDLALGELRNSEAQAKTQMENLRALLFKTGTSETKSTSPSTESDDVISTPNIQIENLPHNLDTGAGETKTTSTSSESHDVISTPNIQIEILPHDLDTGASETKTTSTSSESHDVMSRADDGGPLEAVVTQMSQQMTTLSADVQALKNQASALQNAASSTFVHWGSSSCSADSQFIYTGVIGGGPHDHTGSATNHLCLTLAPVVPNHALPAVATWTAYLTGTEYETADAQQDKDAVCAVCRTHHSTTIMIPGTNICPPLWTKHYEGYLMAGYHDHPAGSEFICVDPALESHMSGNRNDNGRLLYYTITVCGSLPCDPYVNNKLVTCVVCSM